MSSVRLANLEIKLLKQKLDALARRLFGSTSEKLDHAQTQLLFEGLEEIAGSEAVIMEAGVKQESSIHKAPVPRPARSPSPGTSAGEGDHP